MKAQSTGYTQKYYYGQASLSKHYYVDQYRCSRTRRKNIKCTQNTAEKMELIREVYLAAYTINTNHHHLQQQQQQQDYWSCLFGDQRQVNTIR